MKKNEFELWEIKSRGQSLFSQNVIKLIHMESEPYICAECGKELLLPLSELKEICLLSESALKKNTFKGLCPECTRKWLKKQKD